MIIKVVPFIIFFAYFSQVEAAAFVVLGIKGVSRVLKYVMGDKAKQTALKVEEKLDKALGNDVNVGNVAFMDVEMVSLVEPYKKHAIVTDFLAGKAALNKANLELISQRFFTKKKTILENNRDSQDRLDELAGIYIILNESETASTEVLLSATPCLLSNTDHYFSHEPDPCKSLAKESVSKIILRFEDIERLRIGLGEYLKFPSEWDNHWRQVYFRLYPYIEELSLSRSEKTSWGKIKDLIDSKRL